ncbi:MAG: Ig-like domain-containing protein [Longimicrobiales bacterium]
MTPVPAACVGRVLVLEATAGLPPAVAAAIGLSGLSWNTVTDPARCLSVVPLEKPDLVLIVAEAWTPDWAGFAQQLDTRRVTETLPLLFVVQRVDAAAPLAQVPQDSPSAEAFLSIRSLIRRERPALLRQMRQAGSFVLDEEQFRIHRGDRSAVLSKVDACLFGPFFDVKDAVFERPVLATLTFGHRRGTQRPKWHLGRLGRHRYLGHRQGKRRSRSAGRPGLRTPVMAREGDQVGSLLTASTMAADPESLEADGTSTSTITVQLKDANGKDLAESRGGEPAPGVSAD